MSQDSGVEVGAERGTGRQAPQGPGAQSGRQLFCAQPGYHTAASHFR